MNIIFRVDASIDIGSGHVMRCRVLAQELLERGYDIQFACLPLLGNMNEYIESQGFSVIKLSAESVQTLPLHEIGYQAWLQRSAIDDAKDFVSKVSDVDIVITDHYAIDFVWQNFVRNVLGCKIVAIDDLIRVHDADLLIDQTLGREATSYPDVSKVLTGCDYALLNPLFCQSRGSALIRKPPNTTVKVVVSMGGVDKSNATCKVLREIADIPSLSISVLLSPRAPHYAAVKGFCDKYEHINHIDFVSDMAGLMLCNDIAIGAPGTTSWERACLGLPNIIIPIADNQIEISKQLVSNKASILVELSDIPEKLTQSIKILCNEWISYHRNNLLICDGLGVFRTATEIDKLLDDSHPPVSLVKACNDDISLVYEWQCLAETRQYALNTSVPSLKEHKQWMKRKLAEPNDFFYIMVNTEGLKAGVVRLDSSKKGTHLVSVYLSPDFYGKGYAVNAMRQLGMIHPYSTIEATVLKDNRSSQRLFQNLKYKRISTERFIRKPIK